MHNNRHDETEINTQIKRAESDKTYDIYLLRGCQRLPDFGDLVQEAPMLADPACWLGSSPTTNDIQAFSDSIFPTP